MYRYSKKSHERRTDSDLPSAFVAFYLITPAAISGQPLFSYASYVYMTI